jgi:isochorismate hydrolase
MDSYKRISGLKKGKTRQPMTTTTNTTANSLCSSEQSVLMVVDIQGKLTAAMPDKVVNRLRRHVGMLLEAASLLQIPVIATEQYPRGLGNLEDPIRAQLPPGSSLFEKTCFSCADADGLLGRLTDSGRCQVVLAGIEAHVCVLQTAMDLNHNGYQVYVVADAVCSRNRENYENSLQRLRHAGITVTDTESVLFEWVRDSRHEQFKAISAMVRS